MEDTSSSNGGSTALNLPSIEKRDYASQESEEADPAHANANARIGSNSNSRRNDSHLLPYNTTTTLTGNSHSGTGGTTPPLPLDLSQQHASATSRELQQQHQQQYNTNNSINQRQATAAAATAAALNGSMDSPGLTSSIADTLVRPVSGSDRSNGNSAPGSGGGGVLDQLLLLPGGGDSPIDERGSITNPIAIGPPTPSATRLPFLPSAMKKKKSNNDNPSSSSRPTSSSSAHGSSPLSQQHLHHHAAHEMATTTSADSTRKNSESNSHAGPFASASKMLKRNNKEKGANTSANTNATTGSKTRFFSSSSNASASSTSSSRAAAAAAIEEEEKERKRKNDPHSPANAFDNMFNSNAPSTNAYERHYQSSESKFHSKRDKEEAKEERETERLYGPSVVSQQQQHSSSSSNNGNNNNSNGQPSTSRMKESQNAGWPLNHSTAGTGMSRRDSNYRQSDNDNKGSAGGGKSLGKMKSRSRGNTPATSPAAHDSTTHTATSHGFASPHMSPALHSSSAFDGRGNSQEDEENALAAKLGGGIGPTTSRIKRSKHLKAPSSPNNVEGEKMANAQASKQLRQQSGGGEEAGEDTDGTDGSRKKRAKGQLQFSPKVHKPPLTVNLTWKAIKRKILQASTGTPSSGNGSRRSETSETSGGSRRRMYVANAQQHAATRAGAGKTMHPNASGHTGEKTVHIEGDEAWEDADWEVDQVVVDSEWFDDDGNPLQWGTSNSGSAAAYRQTDATGGGASGGHNSGGGTGNQKVSNSGKASTTNHSETAGSLIINPTIKAIDGIVTFFKGYLIPKCAYFFEPRFGDPEKELNFRKERWYNTKRNAAFGCFFLILNWALLVALIKMQGLWQQVLYYGLLTAFVWPMPVFVAFDIPRKYPNFYSFWGISAAMMPGFFGIISMYVCHFLRDGSEGCNGQSFLAIQYYATAFAVIALFSLNVNRLATATAQLIYWILICALLLPESGGYARTAINFLIFSVFVIFLHFQQEKIDRRMFTLRTQLKISYRALQKSQIAEKKASNSKKRFISYIFHEVRVPLNTAYLAFQNLQQTNGFNRQDEDQMVEVYALESSLQQVQQVLNDVLDLQRMDAGKFESSSQPFNFHRAINALVASLKVAATAKRLNLDVSLDERIDNLPQSIEMHGQRASYVIGDEIRLRQVLTNIASNAVKFSREGRGGIKVRTRLIWPEDEEKEQSSEMVAIEEEKPAGDRQNDPASDGSGTSSEWRDSDVTHNHPSSVNHTPFANDSEMTFPSARSPREKERDIEKEAGLHEVDENDGNAGYPPSRPRDYLDRNDSDDSDDYAYKRRPKDFVIVRIEIEDNGPGIRPSDMVDQRLFSAYVQTEIGRVQGGKGSGLGLAIVRAIVQMTRGRLGVKSSKNGTTFWIEQRYYFATPQEVQALHALQELPTPLSFSGEDLPNRPVRPPVKPYRDGESSYSQYSQSKHDAALACGLQSTPTSEVDRSLVGNAAMGSPVNVSSNSIKAGNASISSMPGTPGGGASSIISGGGGGVGNTSATNAIDVHSPLTSEQWTQGSLDRPVLGMPTMSITAPTPQSGSPFPPAPSPTRSVVSASSPSALAAGAPAFMGPSGADLKGTTPAFNRIASDGASSNRSATSSPSLVPQGSPAGEEAFTPGTRESVTSASPEVNSLMSGPPGSISPLPMPPSMGRPETIVSASGLSAAGSQASSGAQPSSQSQQSQPVERLAALIVDDDPLTRKLMSRMMARLGCVVEEAENGQMFLDVALGNEAEGRPAKHFDIVTLDNAMPVMTGEEAIKHFRRAGRKDLVVGATGNALKGDQTSYLRAGVDTVLTKPISARDLTAQLNLARKRRQSNATQQTSSDT